MKGIRVWRRLTNNLVQLLVIARIDHAIYESKVFENLLRYF